MNNRKIGDLLGSSYLNENFRKHLMSRLKGEEADLNVGSHTVESLVEVAVADFENVRKRILDITPRNIRKEYVNITGLKHNPAKGFINGSVIFKRYDDKKFLAPR